MPDPRASERLTGDAFYLGMAFASRAGADCKRRRVGAIIVVERAIVSTGYNGTPFGAKNCSDGGCARCMGDAPPGTAYEACLCVHAEANALLLAARHGNATAGGTLYTTLLPCLSCLKLAIQGGIKHIVAPTGGKHLHETGEIGDWWDLARDCGIRLNLMEVSDARLP